MAIKAKTYSMSFSVIISVWGVVEAGAEYTITGTTKQPTVPALDDDDDSVEQLVDCKI
jgi:hypothetical protein